MGAFVLFPVLLFSIFITSVLGVFDYVHVAILVHAAAQTAVAAAAQDVSTLNTQGNYQLLSTQSAADATAANAVVAGLLTGKPYITNWSCSATTNSYACSINFKVPMPILGSVSATTSATGTYATNVQTTNTSSPSSGPNLPIFAAGTTTLNPGWQTQGGYRYSSGSMLSSPAAGGWQNGNASYSFTIPVGQSSTITYGIPAGGFRNNGPASVLVNNVPQPVIAYGTGAAGQTTTQQQDFWSSTLGPGTYTISLSGSINVYGLYASNLAGVVPSIKSMMPS
jgi:hypothetical protein